MFLGVWLSPFLLLLLPPLCQTANSTVVVSSTTSAANASSTISTAPVVNASSASNKPSSVNSTVFPSSKPSSPTVANSSTEILIDNETTRKMNVQVENAPGQVDSDYRERLFRSVYVIGQKKVTLGIVSKPENYMEKCRPVDPQSEFTQPLACQCSYGYGGPFCSEQKNSKRWLSLLWWPVVLAEIALLIFALARFWRRWSLAPVVPTRRFVEFLMSDESNLKSEKTSTHK